MNNELSKFFKEGSYLNMFFKEKVLRTDAITFTDSEGVFNYMPISNILHYISKCSRKERKAIADIIRQIDIVNGDVCHFLEHLGKGIREQQIKSYVN